MRKLMNGGVVVSGEDVLPCIFAGQVQATFKSGKTGKELTYFLKRMAGNDGNAFWLLSFWNKSEFVYCGTIRYLANIERYVFYKGNKGHYTEKDLVIQSFLYVINRLFDKEYVNVEIEIVSRCRVCGRHLKTVETIKKQIGNDCEKNT